MWCQSFRLRLCVDPPEPAAARGAETTWQIDDVVWVAFQGEGHRVYVAQTAGPREHTLKCRIGQGSSPAAEGAARVSVEPPC